MNLCIVICEKCAGKAMNLKTNIFVCLWNRSQLALLFHQRKYPVSHRQWHNRVQKEKTRIPGDMVYIVENICL